MVKYTTERCVSIKMPGDAKVDLLLGIDKMDVMATDRETRSGLPSAGSTGEMSRPNNLQRIAQKKAQVRNYARNKKLEKLAVYSSCKVGMFGGGGRVGRRRPTCKPKQS